MGTPCLAKPYRPGLSSYRRAVSDRIDEAGRPYPVFSQRAGRRSRPERAPSCHAEVRRPNPPTVQPRSIIAPASSELHKKSGYGSGPDPARRSVHTTGTERSRFSKLSQRKRHPSGHKPRRPSAGMAPARPTAQPTRCPAPARPKSRPSKDRPPRSSGRRTPPPCLRTKISFFPSGTSSSAPSRCVHTGFPIKRPNAGNSVSAARRSAETYPQGTIRGQSHDRIVPFRNPPGREPAPPAEKFAGNCRGESLYLRFRTIPFR